MYQGKFDKKKKQGAVNIAQLISQREEAPADQPAPAKKSHSPKHPARPQEDAMPKAGQKPQKPQRQAPPSAPAKKKRKPRLGGTIFYTVYFLCILLFFVATFFGLQWLRNWLVNYEAAQPTTKSQEVFQQLFTSPDWGALYDAAGMENTAYEGRDTYVAYMEEKVGSQGLNMKETSAGLSGGKKYNVLLGSEKLAAFTLMDNNPNSSPTSTPQWELSKVEIFFDRSESFYIRTMNGHSVYINDVLLGDENIIQIATTVAAEEYLPIGITGVSMCTQEISGLLSQPTVTVFDEKGTQMEVTYDEATRTYTEQTEANTISDEERAVALNAAQAYGKWMISQATRADIAKYFDASSEVYNTITRQTDLWVQSNNGYEFRNENLSDYTRYTDDLFSVRVYMELHVTRTDGTDKEYKIDQSFFFRKQATDKWLCFSMTNRDVSAPVGKVRLTFMDGTTKLTSDLYATDTTKLSTPLVSAPAGKVFSGWYRMDTDENGVTSYSMVFDPDENGNVTIPNGTTLEPMTLYALYETTNTTEGA